MKAFIGMGHLGSNFVKAMLKKGDKVQVWNRTASKAKALEADGARAFDNVADAVRGASIIHVTLKDDDAVNEILEQARAGFEANATIIDHTTTSAQGAKERTELWKERGFTYLHAPVFMGPQNALESTGAILVSGDQGIIKGLEPELTKMTGKVINFGTENNKAAGMKLMGNLFLIALTGGLTDVLALAKSLGTGVEDVTMLFDHWNPGTMVPARLKKMTSNTFDQPSWELNMARKDVRLMMEQAKRGGEQLMVVPAVAKEMDKRIEEGLGHNDWTVIAKDVVTTD